MPMLVNSYSDEKNCEKFAAFPETLIKMFAFLRFYASLDCLLATDVSGQTIGPIVKGQAFQEGCKQSKKHKQVSV
jgi:hypothetical protein